MGKIRTISNCLFIRGEGMSKQVLLAPKNGGRGNKRWSPYGGGLHKSETPQEAVVREIWEEARVVVKKRHLRMRGQIEVHKQHNHKEQEFRIYVFIASEWQRTHIVTDEMKASRWFAPNNLPIESMWPSDRLWIPWVLEGKMFKASFHTDGQTRLLSYEDVRSFG
jgi:8-oxo-dGTP pyrophosphatase MutT (NUDIX family)